VRRLPVWGLSENVLSLLLQVVIYMAGDFPDRASPLVVRVEMNVVIEKVQNSRMSRVQRFATTNLVVECEVIEKILTSLSAFSDRKCKRFI